MVLCLSIAALFFIYLVLGVAMMKSYPVFADMSQVSAIADETGGEGSSASTSSAPQNVDYSPSGSSSTSSDSSSVTGGDTGAGTADNGSGVAGSVTGDTSGSTSSNTTGGDSGAVTGTGTSTGDASASSSDTSAPGSSDTGAATSESGVSAGDNSTAPDQGGAVTVETDAGTADNGSPAPETGSNNSGGVSSTENNAGSAVTAPAGGDTENANAKPGKRLLPRLSTIMSRIYQLCSSLFGFGSKTKKDRDVEDGFLLKAERFMANAVPATAEALGLDKLVEEQAASPEGAEAGASEQPAESAESPAVTGATEDEGVQFQSVRMIGFGLQKRVKTANGEYLLELTNDGEPVTIEQMSAEEGVLAAEKLAIGDIVLPGSVETDKPGELMNLLQQASIVKAAEKIAPDNPDAAVSQVTSGDTVTGNEVELKTNNFTAARIRIPNLYLRYTKVSSSESTE